MQASIASLSTAARAALGRGNWPEVERCARAILTADFRSPEGHFLSGMTARAKGDARRALAAFEKSLAYDPKRYDSATELAGLFAASGQHGKAAALLNSVELLLRDSPRYSSQAGTTYERLGIHQRALPLFERAVELQPEITRFQESLAASLVFSGDLERAEEIYRRLLAENPNHQQNHYRLSQIVRASDDSHINDMLAVLAATELPAEKNIFLYYALGKEYEDIQQWPKAFEFYKRGADTVKSVSPYRVIDDLEVIDKVIECCTGAWLAHQDTFEQTDDSTPVFIVGLPRTGTTLVERIISSHSQVESIGETWFMQASIRAESLSNSKTSISTAIIEAAGRAKPGRIADRYGRSIQHLIGGKDFFIEKLPENFTYLGFVAKAFPEAKLVALNRAPMDACFSLFKQSYFRYSYSFDDLAAYYLAYDRLRKHWRQVLGERLIEVDYEAITAAPEAETRTLLQRLGLDFEEACLRPADNVSSVATASSAQVREAVHTRSVARWKNFQAELEPLRQLLDAGGVYTNIE